MPSKAPSKRVVIYCSSTTGKFVKAGYATKNPRTTEQERIRRK